MNVGQVEFSIRADGLDEVMSKLQGLESVANGIDGRKFNITAGKMANGVEAIGKGFDVASRAGANYDRILARRTGKIAQFGSRMQTLGNTLQRTTSPFFNVFKGAAMGIGYKMLGKFTQSIDGALSRYDTMRTYSTVLSAMGIDLKKKFSVGGQAAADALTNLDNSVRGLPTGLDEIVASMRRYAGATGEAEKATKLAIAANNAFIAGQMESRQQLFTERQLQALAGGAELQSSQWDSLRRNAPMAFRAVAKELKMSVKDMSQSLKQGEISGQKFLDTFIKVGTEGKIAKAAQKMKMTWEAVSQNIDNAFNRMGENVLKSLDKVFKKTTGHDFLQTVLGVDKDGNAVGGGIKDFIDGISESVQNFIESNPEKVMGFFDTLRSIDFKGILQGYGEVAKNFAGVFVGLAKTFGGRNLIHAMAITNIVGKLFSTLGGFGKGLAKPLARATLMFGMNGKFVKFLRGLVGIGKLKGVEEGAETLGKTGEAIHGATLSWQGVANKAVNLAGVYVVARSLKIAGEALQEFDKVKFSPGLAGNVALMSTALTGVTSAVVGIGQAIGYLMKTPLGLAGVAGTAAVEAVLLGVAKAFQLFGSGVKSIAESVQIAEQTKIPSAQKIGQIIETVRKLATAFKGDGLSSIGKWIDSKSIKSQMDAVKKVADSFKSIQELGEIKLDNNILTKAKDNFRDIQEFADQIGEIFKEREEGLMEGSWYRGHKYKNGKEVTPYAQLKQEIKDYGETISSLDAAFTDMDSLVTGMHDLQEKYATISAESQANPLDFSIIKDNVSDIAEAIYSLATGKNGEVYSPFQKLEKAAKQLKGVDVPSITSAFKNIPALMTEMQRVYNEIINNPMFKNEAPPALDTISPFGVKGPEIKKSPLATLEDDLTEMFGVIKRITAAMPDDASSFNTDTELISSAIDSVRQIVLKVQELSTTGANNAGEIDVTGLDKIAEKISLFITKISGALNTMNGLGGVNGVALNAGALNAAVGSIKSALNKLVNLKFDQINLNAVDDLVKRIKEAIRKLNEIGEQNITVNISIMGSVTDSISPLIEGAATKIETGMGSIKSLYAKSVKVTISGEVHEGVSAKINAAVQRIRSAVAKIPTTITRTVKVNINRSLVDTGRGGFNQFHTGGMVGGKKPLYRAFGGFTAMQPRGTDTVPAMLTPGEYVMRRKAVQTFGARFFQGLNHLDLRSALNAISVKAGRSIMPKTGTIINNNKTTNNYNNYNVPITNNAHDSLTGLNRAGRVIQALR